MILSEIAKLVDGILEGDPTVEINSVASLLDAGKGDLSFLSNPKYSPAVSGTNATALLLKKDWKGSSPCPLIRVDDPDYAFGLVASAFAPAPMTFKPEIHPTAVVDDDVSMGENIHIGANCVIEAGVTIGSGTVIRAGCCIGGAVVIGEDCRLNPNVTLREGTILGNRVILNSGVVLGTAGFGYSMKDGRWVKVPQLGIVELGDDVEVGANSTIDRARFGKTLIGNGVKIDNLVQIAHNVIVGDNTIMAAHVGISGSTTFGRNVMIGGQAGFAGHLKIGDNAVIGAGGGVTKDVPAGLFVSDYPAMDHRKAGQMHANIRRLPQLKEKVKNLEARLKELEEGKQT